MTHLNQVPPDRVYAVRYVSRHWVGKPDPSGHGQCEVTYRDPSAAHEAALSLKSKGHKVVGIFPTTATSKVTP